MKPSLELKLGQTLTLTPQLQQSIRLLQLSTLELHQEAQQMLESNPMLEEDDGFSEDGVSESEAAEGGEADALVQERSPDEEVRMDQGQDMPEDLPVDGAWEDVYEPVLPTSGSLSSSASDDDMPSLEARTGTKEGLKEYLEWQMRLTPFSEVDRQIAETIIDSIDDSGYFRGDLAEIAEQLEVEEDEARVVLTQVQHFDPPGVGARDLAECLLIQLEMLDIALPGVSLARELCRHHLEALTKKSPKVLAAELGVEVGELEEAVALVRSLNPRPGEEYEAREPEYITPDVIVKKQGGRWRVELNPSSVPKLRIIHGAERFAKGDAQKYVQDQIAEAKWFLKSMQSRQETILKVSTAIVERQLGFFEHGPIAMKPLILKDIAEMVEMHESTISRVTNQKYMLTPKGIFELKYFFSSQLSTAAGDGASSTAIRALISRLISEEPPNKPLSDSRIAEILSGRGIHIARRTVAKYREAMKISPSSQRKRLV